MPHSPADGELLKGVVALVEQCGGNQSEAARRLGVSRLRVNRILQQEGRVTAPVRAEMWKGLLGVSESVTARTEGQTKPIQVIQDVHSVAIQVLQYMTVAVERQNAGQSGGSHAIGD